MVGRPFWSGQLKISLVTFGVQLYPAVNAQAGIGFHQIDRRTGQRVRHMNVVNQDQPVENTEIVKGFEHARGKYVIVEPEEIQRLRVPTRRVIEVKQFVDLNDLPRALFEKPYFVLPDPKEPQEAYAVVDEAMRQAGKAAVGEVAFGGREHLIAFAALQGKSRGMMAYTMRYAKEMRTAEDYFSNIAPVEVDKRQLAMAADLVKAYTAPFHFEDYKDDYMAALRELVEAKQKNMPLPLEEETPRQPRAVGLMDALRRSLEKTTPAATSPKKPPARAKTGPVLVKTPKRKHKAA